MKAFLILLSTLALCLGKQRYDNYKVYQVFPTTARQLETLRRLEENVNYNFWSDPVLNHTVDVMVPPQLKYSFENLLHGVDLSSKIMIEDVQSLIENEQRSSDRGWSFRRYQTLEEIYDWLKGLEAQYPNVVKLVVGGTTYEGREILGVHVSFKKGNKAVFLEGGIHSREWIAPATVNFILNEILTSTNATVRAVVESRDWYVFPNVNPDGYVYTHTENRMWRKTRKPNSFGASVCYGADPNRNWGYKWNHGGTTSFPCSDLFGGTEAFSEIETKSLSEYITSIAPQLEVYLAFHSFYQYLLLPFGHNGLEVPANNDEMQKIGENAAAELTKLYGTKYKVGNIPEIIYVASGGSIDWVAGVHRNVRLVYTFELRDTGHYGFILPPSQIIPTGEETFSAVISMIQQIS